MSHVGSYRKPHKYPTSWGEVEVSENTIKLVHIIGKDTLSVSDMHSALGLKDKKIFLEFFLNTAIKEGLTFNKPNEKNGLTSLVYDREYQDYTILL